MNVTELSQIQTDPEDDLDLALLEDLYPEDEPVWPTVKVIIGRFLHPFGIHTWVRWMHYDNASKQVLDMNGVICNYCPAARLK